VRDPHRYGSWGLCPFKAITGWDCPFCGGLRATNDLGHGEIGAAWHSNALFVTSIPLLASLWLFWVVRSYSGSERRLPPVFVRIGTISFAVVALGFTIYRNTSWGSAFYVS